jgi:hypothetical protein
MRGRLLHGTAVASSTYLDNVKMMCCLCFEFSDVLMCCRVVDFI